MRSTYSVNCKAQLSTYCSFCIIMNSLFRLAIRPAAGLPMLIASHSELSILNFRDRMGLAVIFWIVEILFSQTHVFFFYLKNPNPVFTTLTTTRGPLLSSNNNQA